MKLHHDPVSTTCRGIVLLATEHGLPLEHRLVSLLAGEHRDDSFAALNPNRAVPVLEADGMRLTEGSAILKYLAEQAGLAAYPSEPAARARVNALMDWFNTGFYREFGYGLVYAQVLREDYGWADPAMQAAALARAQARAERLLGVLDQHYLGDTGPYLGGTEPNLADYLGAAYASIGALIGFDFTPWPRVARWMAAMEVRPHWASCNAGLYGWRDYIRGLGAAA
jgi:glutathione S-transferase